MWYCRKCHEPKYAAKGEPLTLDRTCNACLAKDYPNLYGSGVKPPVGKFTYAPIKDYYGKVRYHGTPPSSVYNHVRTLGHEIDPLKVFGYGKRHLKIRCDRCKGKPTWGNDETLCIKCIRREYRRFFLPIKRYIYNILAFVFLVKGR